MENEQRILEHIRGRAYELWEANGCQQGNDMAHWIEAEREVRVQGDKRRPGAASALVTAGWINVAQKLASEWLCLNRPAAIN